MASPIKYQYLAPAIRAWNKNMARLRISVEWTIGKVSQLFKYLRVKEMHQPNLSALSPRFMVAVLLTNCHSCLYGSQTSTYFDCPPPAVEEYLATLHPLPSELAVEVAV